MRRGLPFLNVDLELRSAGDLSPLVRHWGDRVFVLHHGRHDGTDHLAVELAGSGVAGPGHTVERVLAGLCALVEALPPELRAVWDACAEVDFDVGFQSWEVPVAMAHEDRVQPATVRRIAALGASLTLTVYSMDEARRWRHRTVRSRRRRGRR